MTRPQLAKALLKIGYRIENSHNGLNDFIINNRGNRTAFVVTDNNTIEIRKDLFGDPFSGNFRIELSRIKLSYGCTTQKIGERIPPGKTDRVTLELSKGSSISFYNLDK